MEIYLKYFIIYKHIIILYIIQFFHYRYSYNDSVALLYDMENNFTVLKKTNNKYHY